MFIKEPIKKLNNINIYIEDVNSRFNIVGNNYYQDNYLENINLAKEISTLTKGVILDIGCGDGHLTIPLHNLGAKLIALDNSLTMLEKLSENIIIDNKINLVLADALELPLKDEVIDLVIANNIFHLVDGDKLLKEIIRVLKKDGLFIQLSNDPQSSYYEREYNNYNEIKNMFLNIYWKNLKTIDISPNKITNNFNIILESHKAFPNHFVIKTQKEKFYKKILFTDFLSKIKESSNLFEFGIPNKVKKDIINKSLIELGEIYKVNFSTVYLEYWQENSYIIDVFKK